MERSLLGGVLHGRVGGAAASHQDDFERSVTALEQLEQAQAIAVRQTEIHESHGKLMTLHLRNCASHTRRRFDLVIGGFERPATYLSDVGVGINDQNL